MMTATLIPATAVVVTITIPSTDSVWTKPTVITWKKERGMWQRYWSGYEDNYREMVHDFGAKDPESEVRWANQVGVDVDFK